MGENQMTEKHTKLLKYLMEIRDESVEATKYSRAEGARVREYKRGNQLPDDVIAKVQGRGQPLRWENIIAESDTSLGGIMQMGKIKIKVNSRTNAKTEGALVREKVHMSTMDSTSWWDAKAVMDEDLRLDGLAAVVPRIASLDETDARGMPLWDMEDERIPAQECLIDMFSRKSDYSDARYFSYTRLFDKRVLLRKFPKKKDDIERCTENNREMMRLYVTWYYDDAGEIRIAIWNDEVILEDKPQVYTKVGNRFAIAVRRLNYTPGLEYYGQYRNVLPLQDEVNFAMLRILNMMGSIKLVIEASAVDDVEEFKAEFSQDNAVCTVNDGALSTKRFQVIDSSQNISQLIAIADRATAKAYKIMGISPEMMGQSSVRQSGVALQMKQNAGLVGFQSLIGASHNMHKDIFFLHSGMMAQFYNAETVFAITGKGEEKEYFYVNEYERDSSGAIVYKDGKEQRKNILDAGRYDYTIVEIPWNDGSPDAKMKSWGEITKSLDPKYLPAAIPVIMRDMGSAQSEEMLEVIKRVDEAEAEAQQNAQNQGNAPEMEQLQLEMATMNAKMEEMLSKANLNNAKAEDIKNGGKEFESNR